MPAKGAKRAKAKGEGHAGDISDNISEDDSAGQALDALATRRELTPSMQASEQDDGRPQAPSDIFPAVFSTPSVVRQERNISPDLRLDNAPNLQEQYDLALHEYRYEELPGLEESMLVEQSGMQQQWDLAVKEKRWVDAARYRDIVKSQNAEDTTPAVHALQPSRIKIDRFPTPQALPSVIGEDTIRAAQLAHAHDNPPVQATQEKMDNAVPDKRCTGDSLVLRITHAPILAIPSDIVPAVRTMLEATAAQQDDVRKDDHDNMGQGETTGCDYDASDKMSNATDKLQVQIDDKDVRGGWKNFGQLPAWGDGAGEGGTWDPGPPHIICFLDLSHNFARSFFPDCTLVRS